MKKRSSMRWAAAAVLLLCAAAVATGGCSKKEDEKNYKEVEVTRGEIEQTAPAEGRIVPESQVDIQAEIGGIIDRLPVEVGDRVEKGDLILKLVDEDLKMEVLRAEAMVAESAARLRAIEEKPTPLEKIQAETRIEQALRAMDEMKKRRDRVLALHEKGFVPDSAMDDAQYEYDRAEQELDAGRRYLEELLKGATDEEVEAARSQLGSAEAALEMARERLSKATIYSPISGLVIRRMVEVGDAVSPGIAQGGTSLLEIADVSSLYFEGTVSEADVSAVKVGQEAVIEVDALRNRDFVGEVVRVAPAAQQGGTNMSVVFPIKIEITGDKEGLLTGMRANADIEVRKYEDVLLAPLLAVKYHEDREVVYAPPGKDAVKDAGEDAEPERIQVETGVDDGKMIIIREGLEEGQNIYENYFPEQAGGGKGE